MLKLGFNWPGRYTGALLRMIQQITELGRKFSEEVVEGIFANTEPLYRQENFGMEESSKSIWILRMSTCTWIGSDFGTGEIVCGPKMILLLKIA